jgi:hypothetical protein
VLKGAVGTADALKLAVYGAITFSSLVAFAAAAADRGRRAIGRVLVDVGGVLRV